MSAIILSIPIIYILTFIFIIVISENKRKTLIINLSITSLYFLFFLISLTQGNDGFTWAFYIFIVAGVHSMANLFCIIYQTFKR